MSFIEKWQSHVESKNSLLCVNLDPAEWGQRESLTLKEGDSKVAWSKSIIEKIAPYAAAIKPNRQYFKDISRREMLDINTFAHSLGLLSIDDSKVADIGDTNDAALFHAVQEGFDAITYCPFPGNIAATCKMAQKRGIGLIPLALMSNPAFGMMKNIIIDGMPAYQHYAQLSRDHGAAGVVIGAPSPSNHITRKEMEALKSSIGPLTVLVPGIGAQGGDLGPVVEIFGDKAIVSVGRDIAYHKDPAGQAQQFHESINQLRSNQGKETDI